MDNKIVLITGGTGGIGQATAQLFLDHGAKVVLVDVNQDALDNAKNNLDADKGNIKVIQADVTNEEDVKNYVKETVSAFGKIDVFF
ncbi:SDR family NAD(P)-dependent oxidoreductase [Virgibacillus kimchii]